jgi:phage-related protein
MTIPSELIQEKNKLYSTNALLMLLEVQSDELTESIRLARNIEDVKWNGHTWQRFAWSLGVLGQSGEGKLPELVIQVQNVDRMVQYECEQAGGLVGATVTIYLVSSGHLHLTDPLFTMPFTVLKTEADSNWVTFHLGIENPYGQRFPAHIFTADLCRYRLTTGFKGEECQYAGTASSCDYKWETCVSLGNTLYYGGQPGLMGAIFDD